MSISVFTKPIDPIPPTMLGHELECYFTADPLARSIPVMNNNNEIIGIVDKAPFLTTLNSKNGREIYENSNIEYFINSKFVTLDLNTTIQEAISIIAKSAFKFEINRVIVNDEYGYFGIAETADVYKALANEAANRAKSLEIANNKANAALEAKSRFLATVSHEIRTPLNGILGMAQAITKSCPETLRPLANTILDSGDILLRVVNDVLDMSKVESGKFELSIGDFSLYQQILHAFEINKSNAQSKKLDYEQSIEIPKNLIVQGDSARLKQVLLNFISNSIKFTNSGFVKISASSTIENDICNLIINICDSGIGMSKEFQNRLFKSFEQEDNSNTRGYGGTGLGLAISKSIIDSMGGKIEVVSLSGNGTQFSIYLPFKLAQDQNIDLRQNSKDTNQFDDCETLNILAAEDNKTNQLVLKTLLSEFPINLIFANNGQEAISEFEKSQFDIVFMDLQMPILDGINATKKIREFESNNNRIPTPIFALSANAMDNHREITRNAGFDGHIAKPIILDQLLEAINDAIIIKASYEKQYLDCA
jgi:two-component system, sensor histidine kinase